MLDQIQLFQQHHLNQLLKYERKTIKLFYYIRKLRFLNLDYKLDYKIDS
jgi:hypothetical protein